MKAIRVLVVDDQPIFRIGLVEAVENEADMLIVGEAENGHDSVEKAIALAPDVVVMAVDVPLMSGIEDTKQILAVKPEVRVLVFSALSEEYAVLGAIRAGASGYILKGTRVEEVLDGIRTVHSGKAAISMEVTDALVKGTFRRNRSTTDGYESLSAREQEVLRLIADGRTKVEIGLLLGVATSTVNTYQRRITRKLDIHGKNEIFKYAVRHNLIDFGGVLSSGSD